MKKVHILILKAFFGPFALTFVVAVFILLMIPLIKYAEDIFGKGVEFFVLVRLLFYFSIQTITSALPLALLLASLMAYGNLGERNELTALKASGISFQKAMLPIFFISCLLTYSAFEFGNRIIPNCNLKLYSLLYDVKQQKPAMEIKSGVFYNGIDGYSIKVIKPNPESDEIKKVMIYNHNDYRGNSDVIMADSGRMYRSSDKQFLKLDLYSGVNYAQIIDKNSRDNKEFVRSYFNQCNLLFDLSSFNLARTKEELFSGNRIMLNVGELKDTIYMMQNDIKKTRTGYIDQMRVYYRFYIFDTVLKSYKPKAVNFKNKFISNFNQEQQNQIIKNAQIQARSVQSFTSVYSNMTGNDEKELRRMGIEYHFKYSLAFACLLMFVIGAPLGAIVKKGGFGFPVLLSILLYIIYYVLSIMGKKWAQEDIYSVPFGMWFSVLVMLPVGFYFFWVAINDKPIINFSLFIFVYRKCRKLIRRFF